MAAPNPPPVVIDNGSWTIKAGFSADRSPRIEIPSVVGREGGNLYVGEDIKGHPGAILERVISRGKVGDWDAMVEIWKETFKGLNTYGDKQPVLLTEPALVSKSDREKTTEIMFEYFNTPSMYLADQCILSLYASGKMEGIVLGSGYGLTQVVPCHKGNLIPNSNLRLELAGQDLTDYFGQILVKQNISSETLRNIKEKLCYVALDYETEIQTAAGGDTLNKTYTLPDGQNVIVGKERFQCPEVLFKPSLVGNQSNSVAKLICDGIGKCSGETGMETSTLYKNIVVAGGSSLFPGMVERVQKDVQALAPAGTTVDVMAAPGGTGSSFIGGSILTCLQDFHPMWVERKHYDESGPGIVHTKCV